MSVWIFTTELPLYLPTLFDRVLQERGDRVDRIIFAEPPLRRLLRQQYRIFGPIDGLRMAGLFTRGYLLSMLAPARQRRLTGRLHSVRAAAETHDVPVEHVADVNDPAFIDRVEAAAPELIFSIICGQRFETDILGVPDWPINLHPSLLPDYRGPAPEFWALYHDEKRTGWTAHIMNEEFDAGPIIDQWSINIESDETLHSLTRRLAEVGADVVIEMLGQLPDPAFETRPNPATEEDYYSAPTAAERREFKRRGNKLL